MSNVMTSNDCRNIRSVLCKGSRFPATVPLPTVVVTPMSLPLCQPATEKSLLEQTLLKGEMCASLVAGGDLQQVVYPIRILILILIFIFILILTSMLILILILLFRSRTRPS